MNIAIVGAGIAGITTAYELAFAGHQVTVFERHGSAAVEASFATAGLMAPAHAAPWPTPDLSRQLLGQLWQQHSAVKLNWPLGQGNLNWLWQAKRAGQPATYHAHRAHLHRLAVYSRDCLHQITTRLQVNYDRSEGILMLLRTEADRAQAQLRLQLLRDNGTRLRELTPKQTHLVEPALNPDTPFVGAIHLLDDEVGNCRQFALLLKNEAQRLGVNFQFGSTVARVEAGGQLWLQAATQAHRFDAVVLCSGLHSAALLRPLGLKLPLTGVRGYSVSAQIREPLNAPRSAIVDDHYQVAITRLGRWVRVAGTMELGRNKPDQAGMKTLYKVLQDWFPGAPLLSSGVQEWQGTRPMLPDDLPLLGASGTPGLWLNLGHGDHGWTLGCGSARVLTNLIGKQPAEIDLQGLGLERLHR